MHFIVECFNGETDVVSDKATYREGICELPGQNLSSTKVSQLVCIQIIFSL
jgi:hypothetical protein